MSDLLRTTRLAFRRAYDLDLTDADILPETAAGGIAARGRHRLGGLIAAAGLLPETPADPAVQARGTGILPVNHGRDAHATRRGAGDAPRHGLERRAVYAGIWRAQRLAAETERVWRALDPVIPDLCVIKGSGLAVQAWPQVDLRDADDIDLRCKHLPMADLDAAMQTVGYRPAEPDGNLARHLWHFGWGASYRHPDGYTVEINHRLFPVFYPSRSGIGHAACWPCEMAEVGASAVRVPTPGAHLLVAALHAVWHGGERLAWIVDVAGLMVRHPGSLAEALSLADRSAFTRRSLIVACRVGATVFGTDILPTEGAPTVMYPDARVTRAATLYLDQVGAGQAPRFGDRHRLHRALTTRGEWIGIGVRRGVIPGVKDFQSVRLPPALGNLYAIIRPLRLCGSMLRRVAG